MKRKPKVEINIDRLLAPLCRFLAVLGIGPDAVTLFGLLVTLGVPWAILHGHWFGAGCWLLAGGFFDVLDGALARHLKRRPDFGAFWDSTLDRIGEALVFGGLLLYYAQLQDLTNLSLTFIVQILSFLVPYARARAEGLGLDCRVGILPRPGRVILLTLGFWAKRPEAALWIVGALSLVTFIQRVFWVWQAKGKKIK